MNLPNGNKKDGRRSSELIKSRLSVYTVFLYPFSFNSQSEYNFSGANVHRCSGQNFSHYIFDTFTVTLLPCQNQSVFKLKKKPRA